MESPRSSGSRTAIRSSKHGSLQPDLSTSANSTTEVVTAAAASAFDQHLFDSILSAIYVPEHHSTWSRAADAHAALSPQVISNRPHAARDAQPAKELSTDEALDAIYADAVQAHARMGNLDLGRSLPVLNHAAEINAQNHNSVALSMDSSEVYLRDDIKRNHWFFRLQKMLLMTPPTNPKVGLGQLRYFLSPFFRYFGQVMLVICDALMLYRMISIQSYHITVSVMCPVFHIGVLAITWGCDAALKAMKTGMIDVPVSRAVLLRKFQTVMAVAFVAVILFMVVLFVVWTPLNQAEEGTVLFKLSSLHRLWLTDVALMYQNVAFNALYSLGMMTLGFMWAGILLPYFNGTFIAWSRLCDCSDLVIKLRDRTAALTDTRIMSASGNRRGSMDARMSNDEADDEMFRTVLETLVDAVNDCLSVRSGMAPMVRLGFVSVMFDVVLLTLFLVFSLLIVSCSSVCKTYGTEAYQQMQMSGVKPCVYTMDNAFLVAIWSFGVLMHLVAWLLPLAFLNNEVSKIREVLVKLPMSFDGRFISSSRFMKRFLESYEHSLLVHAFSKDGNLMCYDLPFIGLVEYSTVSFFLSAIATLYGLVYSAIGARQGVNCSSFL